MNKAGKCTFPALHSMKTAAGMYKINNEERFITDAVSQSA